jgi:hypothetical protein
VIADKGYDSEKIREQIKSKDADAVIQRKIELSDWQCEHGLVLHRYRYLVEKALPSLRNFRALATRYDKLKCNYPSVAIIANGFLWL